MAYTGSIPIPPESEAMRRATYDDVLNAPENKVAEILDGELFLSPRPALRHARASSKLGALLDGPFDRGRGGLYADAGVGHAWLLDPIERTLEVLRLREGAWTIATVLAGFEPCRVEPFDAVELELGVLWP